MRSREQNAIADAWLNDPSLSHRRFPRTLTIVMGASDESGIFRAHSLFSGSSHRQPCAQGLGKDRAYRAAKTRFAFIVLHGEICKVPKEFDVS
jgi:hypothetical protein